MTNEQLADEVNASDDVIDYRKREAIKLFGLFIWSYASRREQEDIIAGIVEPDNEIDNDNDDDESMYGVKEG